MSVVNSDQAEPDGAATGSLEALFGALERPLLRYAQGLVRDAEIAEDIVQESFMRLHTQFDRVERPTPWLYRTAHNLALNHLRAGRKIVPLDPEDNGAAEPADPGHRPDEATERVEAIACARVCLESLPERERKLVAMKFEEGLSYKEMSERTGLTVGHVGYLLHHALRRLGDQLEKEGVEL